MNEDTWSNEGMECPYCNEVNEPDDAMDYSEDDVTQFCGSCGEEFTSSCFVSHSWTSKTVEE